MVWNSLSDRLDQLPLILAGPILRRTEPERVTVWMALRAPCSVTLTVLSTTNNGATLVEPILTGTQTTVQLGASLYLVAVTATPFLNQPLQSDRIYAYDLQFQPLSPALRSPQTLHQALTAPLVPNTPISYFPHHLPTFALPPTDIHQLKLVHGSCRKLHGKGHDALAILDELIAHHAPQADARPHHLFLTGDQIYGDDVADPLLWALTRVGNALLGWEERLPLPIAFDTPEPSCAPQQLEPGQRSHLAETQAGFTAGLRDKPERAKSHLFSLGEYCSIYLYAWSPVMWAFPLPTAAEVGLQGKEARHWNTEREDLLAAAHTLWKVRRAMANVPTYMIFDDHDISDDWNLNQAWCLRVLGKPLGKRAVQNGLLAYALFQAWGNTPEQFAADQPGAQLLQLAATWSATAGTDLGTWNAIARYLGLPPQTPVTELPQMRVDDDTLILDQDPQALTWHYTICGPQHTVIVLDTRTWRGFPLHGKTTAPPKLLSPTAFEQQLHATLQATACENNPAQDEELTLIVAPTNLFSLQLIDQIQHWNLKQHEVYKNDVGDAWNIHREALATFLKTLFEYRQRVVVLSGDIHYGSVVHLEYWPHSKPQPLSYAPSDRPTNQHHRANAQIFNPADPVDPSASPQVLVQLTASAFKNAETKTRLVHTRLKSLWPERDRTWIGWDNPLELQEVTPGWREKLLGPLGHPKLAHPEPPDWHYQIHWVPRQPIQAPFWGREVDWLRPKEQQNTWRSRVVNWFRALWYNRWFQEGREVVGLNNIGVVHFEEFRRSNHTFILQDLYWYSPWKAQGVVFSRYCTSLNAVRSAETRPLPPAIEDTIHYSTQS